MIQFDKQLQINNNKMFKFLVVLAFVAYAAANSDADAHAEIKVLTSDVRADGFDAALETSNGIQQSASGDEHGNAHGSFSWESPEGEHIKIDYVADEHGYQPVGQVVPTPHPIPPLIQKALEYLAAHPDKSVHKR